MSFAPGTRSRRVVEILLGAALCVEAVLLVGGGWHGAAYLAGVFLLAQALIFTLPSLWRRDQEYQVATARAALPLHSEVLAALLIAALGVAAYLAGAAVGGEGTARTAGTATLLVSLVGAGTVDLVRKRRAEP